MSEKESVDLDVAGQDACSTWIRGIVRGLVTLLVWPLFWPRVSGSRMEPEGEGCILVANHHHVLDPIFITYFFPTRRLSMVAKQELYRMKLIGRILQAFHTIPLDRSAADIRASKRILSQIKAGRVVGIFPEGTRVRPEGAAQAELHTPILIYAVRRGIPVLPVSVEPRYRLFGRPRYTFGHPVRYRLKEGIVLTRQEQEGIAREMMRRIYEEAGLAYTYEGLGHYGALFDDLISQSRVTQVCPVGRRGRVDAV